MKTKTKTKEEKSNAISSKNNDIDVFSPDEISRYGLDVIGWFRVQEESYTSKRIFRATFGVSSQVISILWDKVKGQKFDDGKRDERGLDHLFWSLIFLKVYSSETVHSTMIHSKISEKIFRKWAWRYVRVISNIFPDLVRDIMLFLILWM